MVTSQVYNTTNEYYLLQPYPEIRDFVLQFYEACILTDETKTMRWHQMIEDDH